MAGPYPVFGMHALFLTGAKDAELGSFFHNMNRLPTAKNPDKGAILHALTANAAPYRDVHCHESDNAMDTSRDIHRIRTSIVAR